MQFDRYFRFYSLSGSLLEFGQDWGVYEFPDGQNQIWFSASPSSCSVCLNHPSLLDLLRQVASIGPVDLFVTYLYGARCDKVLSGDRRVAHVASLSRSLCLEASKGRRLTILVPHDSPEEGVGFPLGYRLEEYDGLIYPDASARERQPWLHDCGLPEVVFEKVRDQETGAITGLTPSQVVSQGRWLVTDDICDGGSTFVKVAGLLPGCRFDLAVAHGVFSGSALSRLGAAGFDRIFTTNSFVQHSLERAAEIEARCSVMDIWEEL